MSPQFLSRDVLLGLGVCLIMLGVVMRGFARSYRRDTARRKEHRRDERKSGDDHLSSQLEQPPEWLEKNLGWLANLVLGAGAVIAVLAFSRS
jgi:Zn-dependent protease with chaperone function